MKYTVERASAHRTLIADTMLPIVLLALAVLLAIWIDHATHRRGLTPPAFHWSPESPPQRRFASLVLRTLAWGAVALVLWAAVLVPLVAFGQPQPESFEAMKPTHLFLLHVILLLALGWWFALGFAPGLPLAPSAWARAWSTQFGWRCREPWREIGLGLAAGAAGWLAVVAAVAALAAAVGALGGEDWLPREPPTFIEYLISLPVGVRLAVALSAGLVEETFFRGFLQPRVGIGLSSLLFVLAHLSYGQPLMLVGVAILSLLFAVLVVWRRSIWAAVVAHATFDAIQLLVVLPLLSEYGL